MQILEALLGNLRSTSIEALLGVLEAKFLQALLGGRSWSCQLSLELLRSASRNLECSFRAASFTQSFLEAQGFLALTRLCAAHTRYKYFVRELRSCGLLHFSSHAGMGMQLGCLTRETGICFMVCFDEVPSIPAASYNPCLFYEALLCQDLAAFE